MRSPLPSTPTSLHTLTSQVAGHPRVLSTRDGLLIIKLARPVEREFYQTLVTNPILAPLQPFTPRFLGTLWLEGQIDECLKDPDADLAVIPVESGQKVLENLAHGFSKPNILDIKLGTVFYDEATLPAKVKRVKKTARETTSWETGMRLTSFQVYNNNTSLPVDTPKSYGKSIRPCDLPEGIARFFPIGTSASGAGHVVPDAPTADSMVSVTANSGLPCRTLLPLLHAIRSQIIAMRAAYASLEIRMVGGSLLIIYESDWARAEEGVRGFGATADRGKFEGEERVGNSSDHGQGWQPHVVKLIDFAHARLAPGAGPDEGVLKGLDSVIALLDSRIHDLGSGNR